jgi:hypothetical protein
MNREQQQQSGEPIERLEELGSAMCALDVFCCEIA